MRGRRDGSVLPDAFLADGHAHVVDFYKQDILILARGRVIGRKTADDEADHAFLRRPVLAPARTDANALELLVRPDKVNSLIVHAVVNLKEIDL